MPPPERYLRTQQVAETLQVSVSTIKRWVDAGAIRATRTVGKHRLIPLEEVIRLAGDLGLPREGLEGLFPERQQGGEIDDRDREALAESLRLGDAGRARRVIRSVVASGCGAVALADWLIRPVMERIGQSWMVGTLDVYQEHQASQIVASVVTELNERLARGARNSGPLALGAATEGDPYSLPLLLSELALRELGWEVRNLGVNLPLRSLANAALHYRPRLIFLSVNHLEDATRFIEEYRWFQQATTFAGAAVVVGGRALGHELRSGLVHASFADRMVHLVEFVRRLAPVTASAMAPADAVPLSVGA
ncbi:MAG: excisionase family DNA-binding protein [Isosphaeraceae bacterium]